MLRYAMFSLRLFAADIFSLYAPPLFDSAAADATRLMPRTALFFAAVSIRADALLFATRLR